MIRITPLDHFWLLNGNYVQVDYDGFLTAANQHAYQWLGGAGVDLLMRHEGRHKNKIAGPRLGDILQ